MLAVKRTSVLYKTVNNCCKFYNVFFCLQSGVRCSRTDTHSAERSQRLCLGGGEPETSQRSQVPRHVLNTT